jgi:hypothetical protein
LNYFFDDNYAWFNRISEYCVRLDCLHQRCADCFDPGPAYWPIQYADGRPIQHLFEELQSSLEGYEGDGDTIIRSGSEPGSGSSHIEVSSDEERWSSILRTARGTVSEIHGDTAAITYPCPLRETHFCPERFQSEEAAWQHSSVHVGQETIPCALASCRMTFQGKDAMRLHYIAMHS